MWATLLYVDRRIRVDSKNHVNYNKWFVNTGGRFNDFN
jgi:hypothetical protein